MFSKGKLMFRNIADFVNLSVTYSLWPFFKKFHGLEKKEMTDGQTDGRISTLYSPWHLGLGI